jgi:endonuclease/exonuclease/phosphatase (EEP) superfamily protein YafD
MKERAGRTGCLPILLGGYFAALLGWLALYLLAGDRYGYLGMFHLLAVYLFFPLPLALVGAAFCRQRGLWLAGAACVAAFSGCGVGIFAQAAAPQPDTPALRVMTFNVLARHPYTQPVIETIRAAEADVVLLQEVNTSLAQALQAEMSGEYPYQVLKPQDNPYGMGVLSRFPLHEQVVRLAEDWIGEPLVLEMDWQGRVITLVNFHMRSTTRPAEQAVISAQFRARQVQAQALADFASGRGAVILGGDANAGPLSQAYAIFTGQLQDAWREAGFGLGHTFPCPVSVPGIQRPNIGGRVLPSFLTRIDYLFASPEWQIAAAHLAPISGVADHCAVVADFWLPK